MSVLTHALGLQSGTLFENINIDHKLYFLDEKTRVGVQGDLLGTDRARQCARFLWITPFVLYWVSQKVCLFSKYGSSSV